MSTKRPQLSPDELAEIHAGLADPTRLQILRVLAERGEMASGELAEAVGKTQARTSQHLMFLRRTGWIESRKEGLFVYYRLSDPMVHHALAVLHFVLAQQRDEE